jgi:large subunit ribosomal protein L24
MERKFNKQPKLHIKTGDTVKVLSGDDKGKTGKVLSVNLEKRRALIEGLNMVTKHVKPTAANPQGGIEKKEASIHVSNLMLVDPKTGEATRIGRKLGENGKLVRYSKKTGEVING